MSPRFTISSEPESESHKRTNHQARARRRAANPAATRYNHVPTEFVCIDGEGVTDEDGNHRYVLLGCGNQQISNPDGLSMDECLEFLWSQFRTGSVAYTGFFLGYDFTQMLRSLPEERARMLLTAEGRAKRKPRNDKRVMPFPVRWNGWEFDILGTKRFKFRREGAKRWMHICDTGPFFQKSFLKVIDPKEWKEPVVTQEEYDEISRGKANRSDAVLDDDMRKYNRLENGALSRVLPRLNEGFQQLGIHLRPSQWYGPGQAASEWLKTRAVTAEKLQEITPSAVLEAAIASYYGGWFEIAAHGIIPGITWEYDINSAYPAIISRIPCLEHGKWTQNTDTGGYRLVHARVRGKSKYLGAMLHRDRDGNISRPCDTEGWYWETELHAAKAAKLISRIEIIDAWEYQPCKCPPPLREVAGIYALRQQAGKKTPLGIACKLVPNSLYGKFAQSVGSPKYGNPVYASMITSGCRTMILSAIAAHPNGAEDILMVATDGVYFRTRHTSLDTGSGLGQWEENQKHDLTLFKPGVYWDNTVRQAIQRGDAPVFKARGVNARDFGTRLAEIDAQFTQLSAEQPDRITWPKVTFPLSFSMITAIQALQRNDWALAGTLNPDPQGKQSSCPIMKRENWFWENGILRSHPAANKPYEPSHPYQKRFGLEDPWSPEAEATQGITPDGLPNTLIRDVLYDH